MTNATDTYTEALTWTTERIDCEIAAIVSFLRANCAVLPSTEIAALGAEMRALRKARWTR